MWTIETIEKAAEECYKKYYINDIPKANAIELFIAGAAYIIRNTQKA